MNVPAPMYSSTAWWIVPGMTGCTERDPFTPAFVSSWNGSWGANHVGAVVEDRDTGCVYEFGDPGAQFPLASVAKVLIMAATLEAVQSGSRSLGSVSGPLDRMIRVSDNAAAQSLWNLLGGFGAVNDAAARWGLGGTLAAAGRGFGGTLSVAADQVRVVKELIGSEAGPLADQALRLHARTLMTTVDAAQAWGVSAGVPAGWTVALKNGWWATQPGDIGPAGRWRVNSVGMVWDETGAERWTIAVLGNTWPNFATGVAAIEAIAAQVAGVLSRPSVSIAVPWTTPPPVPTGDAAAFTAITPTRIVDTRADGSTLSAGSVRPVDASANAPSAATAAVAHLTAVGAQDPGYLTAFACGQPPPPVSNVNYTPSRPSSTEAIVTLTAGQMCVYSSATTDLIVDISGAYTPDATLLFTPAPSPMRLLDTRATVAVVAAGSTTTVVVPSLDGWPPRAALVNITADSATAAGYLTAYASDQPSPATSTVNYVPSVTTCTAATIATAPDGGVSISNSAPVAIVVDLIGVFTENPAGHRYQAVASQRLLDTRSGTGGWLGPLGAGQTITVALAVPPGVTAVGTLTAHAATAPGYITMWAGDGPAPPTSNLNTVPGDTVANLAATRTAADGSVAIFSQPGHHHLIYDLTGWYT